MSDQDRELVLVTGATDGIGLATATELARRGLDVIVHGRSDAKIDRAIDAIAREAPGAVLHRARADLASLAETRAMGDELRARFPRLDVLLLNAGVITHERTITADGIELTMAVNHFAHVALAHALLPSVRAASPSRVITVASMVHHRGRIELDDLRLTHRRFEGVDAYAASKLANVIFARELAERLAGTGVTSNSLHPGVIATKLLRGGWGGGGAPLERGARTSVYLATEKVVADRTGLYWDDCRPSRPHPLADDAAFRLRFWDATEAVLAAR